MDRNPSGFSVHGILQARILEWVDSHSLTPGDLPDPGINPGLLHFRQILYQGSPAGFFFSLRVTADFGVPK